MHELKGQKNRPDLLKLRRERNQRVGSGFCLVLIKFRLHEMQVSKPKFKVTGLTILFEVYLKGYGMLLLCDTNQFSSLALSS